MYVADYYNHRIHKFDSNGNFIAKWGKKGIVEEESRGTGDGEFDRPSGIAVDSSSDYVYVADYYNHRIHKFDSNGNFIAKWGKKGIVEEESRGTGDGEFDRPSGIAVDSSSDYVYVADTYNHRIQVFPPATT